MTFIGAINAFHFCCGAILRAKRSQTQIRLFRLINAKGLFNKGLCEAEDTGIALADPCYKQRGYF
jgi:hypothetical protein